MAARKDLKKEAMHGFGEEETEKAREGREGRREKRKRMRL